MQMFGFYRFDQIMVNVPTVPGAPIVQWSARHQVAVKFRDKGFAVRDADMGLY